MSVFGEIHQSFDLRTPDSYLDPTDGNNALFASDAAPPDGSRTVIGVYESISGSNIYYDLAHRFLVQPHPMAL